VFSFFFSCYIIMFFVIYVKCKQCLTLVFRVECIWCWAQFCFYYQFQCCECFIDIFLFSWCSECIQVKCLCDDIFWLFFLSFTVRQQLCRFFVSLCTWSSLKTFSLISLYASLDLFDLLTWFLAFNFFDLF